MGGGYGSASLLPIERLLIIHRELWGGGGGGVGGSEGVAKK